MSSSRHLTACPDCRSPRFMVVWSKTQPDGSVERIRECMDCGSRWWVTAPAEIVRERTAKTYGPE